MIEFLRQRLLHRPDEGLAGQDDWLKSELAELTDSVKELSLQVETLHELVERVRSSNNDDVYDAVERLERAQRDSELRIDHELTRLTEKLDVVAEQTSELHDIGISALNEQLEKGERPNDSTDVIREMKDEFDRVDAKLDLLLRHSE